MKPTQIRCIKVGDMFGDKLPFTEGKVYDLLHSPLYDIANGYIKVSADFGGMYYLNLNSKSDGEWRYTHPSFRHETTNY